MEELIFRILRYIREFRSMRDLSDGSECDLGSEKVIILTTRFAK